MTSRRSAPFGMDVTTPATPRANVFYQPLGDTYVAVHRGEYFSVAPSELALLAKLCSSSNLVDIGRAAREYGIADLGAWLEGLTKAGLLVTEGPRPEPIPVRPLPSDVSAVPIGKYFVLSRKSLVRPCAEGMCVWSQWEDAHFLLDGAAISLLPAFSRPTTVADVLDNYRGDREQALSAVSRMVACGLLFAPHGSRLRQRETSAPARKAPRRRPVMRTTDLRDRIPVYPVFLGQLGHPPLALGMIVAHAKAFCDGILEKKYHFITEWFDSPEAVLEAYERFGRGVFLFSNYIWSERPNLQVAAELHARDPRSVMIFGGPSMPKYEAACAAWFARHPFIDVGVREEGEVTAAETLLRLAESYDWRGDKGKDLSFLRAVRGLTFRAPGEKTNVVRTDGRPRTTDLSLFPSPYLTGLFDNLSGHIDAMIFETNRGCPYGCAFCDWGSATLQKIQQFSLERVAAELEWAGRNGVQQIWCADANFGIFPRDVEIARLIVATREKYGAPVQMTVNYAKNATERHTEILKILGDGGVYAEAVLSIQSTDPQVLETVRRKNIKTEKYDALAEIFRKEELQFASDLMYGLPGDTVEGFKNSLQHFFERDVFVQIYRTLMLPNAPMADPAYIEKYKLKIVPPADSIGASIITDCFSFTAADLEVMGGISSYYRLACNLDVLKYVLWFVQLDHGIRAVDVLHRMYESFHSGEFDRYPGLSWLLNRYQLELRRSYPMYVIELLDAPGMSWEGLFDEVGRYFEAELLLPYDSAMRAVLAAQAAILPSDGREMPRTLELQHDVAAYLSDNRPRGGKPSDTRRPLASYGPGTLHITDPFNLCMGHRQQRRDHIVRFALDSEMSPISQTEVLRAQRTEGETQEVTRFPLETVARRFVDLAAAC